ncbi:MAG: SUMF1/EgtB/PvdO family nonheme iron enzyme, partial [Kiritimatiellia bacterium]|nr:SUMF1/EgtB/PvdO family nonheme iron enzyme [Kiritimatiellia bacterium]
MDQLVALGKQREQYQKDLDAAKAKAEQEKRKREAEMATLRAQELANRKKKFDAEYAKYKWVLDSQYMQQREKKQAWTLICSNWGVTDATDGPGVLFWDDDTGIVSAKAAGPAPGQDLVVDLGGGVDMELVWIEPGSFMMGSPSGEDGRDDDEKQHRVTLTKGFWMGKYEVTQAQWQQVMGSNPSHFKNAGQKAPVESVSWDDCQGFVRKLNGTGIEGTFSLPTEAQWEYACRAGTTTRFGFGEGDGDLWRYGNYCERSCSEDYSWKDKSHTDGHDKTAPAGSFKPNEWGLYDMHGNVWEWCQDWHSSYPSSSVRDPTGSSSGSYRVLRGGSWFSLARYCRS